MNLFGGPAPAHDGSGCRLPFLGRCDPLCEHPESGHPDELDPFVDENRGTELELVLREDGPARSGIQDLDLEIRPFRPQPRGEGIQAGLLIPLDRRQEHDRGHAGRGLEPEDGR